MGGVITAIAGGIFRDVLLGHKSLLNTTELYITPVMTGSMMYLILSEFFSAGIATSLGVIIAFSFRCTAIHWNLSIPVFLQFRSNRDD